MNFSTLLKPYENNIYCHCLKCRGQKSATVCSTITNVFPSLRFLPRSTVSTADVLINLLTTPQEIILIYNPLQIYEMMFF